MNKKLSPKNMTMFLKDNGSQRIQKRKPLKVQVFENNIVIVYM